MPTREQELFQKFEEYIKSNIASELSIPDLEKHMAMGYSNIYRIVKSVSGRSLRDRLLHYRIEKAIELLSTTNRNISEIMQETGFNNSNYFSKAFKKATGMNPSRFREARRKNGI